ncbi:anti-sigma factor domain-containing protein [Neobacillus niacini]|uniref:anti-sigma factor domain-containing protein n=1 Tax=Neobacillus niacini TaxID=86668 RepID=UPI00286A8D82|nr:anti-sigma factor domain-containing protein [Neobacillus niacini]
MEVDDPYLTLLTPNGEFLRARKMDRLYFIGEEIDFFPVTDYIGSKKTNSFKNIFTLKPVWMSIAVVVICIGSIIPVHQSNKAYAYMSIDASTSIEMGLNKNMQVVELKGFNKEAEKIILQLDDWKKKDASELTTIILAELKEEGYIAHAEPVVISTVKTNQLKDKAATKLQENIDEIKQTVDKNLVEVNMYTTTKAEIEKAKSAGVSVGVYHDAKNNSAQNKEKAKSTKVEKTKHKNIAPSESSATSPIPPGQIKKQDENNSNPDITNQSNQNQSANNTNENNTNENNNSNIQQQINGNQASSDKYKGNGNGNKDHVKQNGNENGNKDHVKQNGNNKMIKHDNQQQNNQNKSKEKNGN